MRFSCAPVLANWRLTAGKAAARNGGVVLKNDALREVLPVPLFVLAAHDRERIEDAGDGDPRELQSFPTRHATDLSAKVKALVRILCARR